MVLAFETSTNEIRTITYNGTTRTWGTVSAALSTAAFGNVDYNRPFDVSWDVYGGTNRALLVYSDATALRYRVSTDGGATWGSEQTLDATRQAYWVQMTTEPNGFVHMAVNDQNDDLNAWTWDGSAWTFQTPTAISADLGWANNAGHDHAIEPFALATFPADATTKVRYRSIGTRANYGTAEAEGAGTTVTIATVGSTTVTGSGTTWLASNRGRGDRITIGANSYVVLRVDSNTQLTLASPAAATATGAAYTIARQFTTLQAWEDCISFTTACTYFPVASASLVADDRSEVGIAYKDSTFKHSNGGAGGAPLAPGAPILSIDGPPGNTDSDHTITLTADGANRHHGLPGTGVVLDNETDAGLGALFLFDDNITLEWLEIKGGSGATAHGIVLGAPPVSNQFNVRYNLVHDVGGNGVDVYQAPNANLLLANNIIHTTGGHGVYLDPTPFSWFGQIQVLNNTVSNAGGGAMACFKGVGGVGSNQSHVLLANNIGYYLAGAADDFDFPDNDPANGWADVNAASQRNLSSDSSATRHNIIPGGPVSGGTVNFVNFPAGDLHLNSPSDPINGGADLTSLIARLRHRRADPPGGRAWDIGADEYGATTAVTLMSFEALPSDGAVDLLWRTGSEVDNLGFHVYRGLVGRTARGHGSRRRSSPGRASRPWAAAMPGVTAASQNGTRYFYRLEDVDTKSVSTFHGPVSAVPQAAAAPPAPPEGGGSGGGSGSGGRLDAASSCPAWALAQLGSSASYTCQTHGDPAASSFRVLSRTSRSALVELETGGFLTARDATGRVRALVPGFDSLSDPLAPALPLKRARLDGVVGRQARIGSDPGAREPLLHRPRRRRRRLPAGRRRPRRHGATGPSGSRARPLPRRLPPRAGAPRRRGLPGRGQDPRPRADAPALRRLARRARPLPTAHRARRLRRRRTLRDRTRTARPQNPRLALRRERLRLPRHVAEGPALRRLRGALPGTAPAPRPRLDCASRPAADALVARLGRRSSG